MLQQENVILGQEKISKLLLKFSVPCVTGLLISTLYNIVDQIFIGNSELGYLGNAATGVSFPVICIANAFAWCVGDALYQEFAIKTFRIYLSPTAITCLVKMIAVFFQSIRKSVRAVVASLIRDIICLNSSVKQAVIAQEQIIRKIADHGACVIVGRAADYVLRDYDNVIRIFIHAPKEYRVNKIMEMYGDSREEALNNMRHSDPARAAYYHNISGQNWGETRNYSLCHLCILIQPDITRKSPWLMSPQSSASVPQTPSS